MKKLLLSFGVVFMAILGLNNVSAQIEKGADNLSTGASSNVRTDWLQKLGEGNAGMSVTNQSTQSGIVS